MFSSLVGLFDQMGLRKKRREDGRNGLPSVSGIRHPVGGVIRTVGYGRSIILLGETESDSKVFALRGGVALGSLLVYLQT